MESIKSLGAPARHPGFLVLSSPAQNRAAQRNEQTGSRGAQAAARARRAAHGAGSAAHSRACPLRSRADEVPLHLLVLLAIDLASGIALPEDGDPTSSGQKAVCRCATPKPMKMGLPPNPACYPIHLARLWPAGWSVIGRSQDLNRQINRLSDLASKGRGSCRKGQIGT